MSGWLGKNEFSENYSEKSLFDKIKNFAQKAGIKLIYAVLLLYYTLQKDDVPVWAKGVIISALGYFILPVDLIPDFTPIVGTADDLAFLISALIAVSCYIDDEIKTRARNKLKDWFGDYNEDFINEFEIKNNL